jgi:hypothetical protein
MTTITASSNMPLLRLRGKPGRAGYTLAEVLIASTIALVVVVIVTGAMLFISQWYLGLGNYLQMNQQSRIALEWIGRDLRMSSTVVITTEDEITLTIPAGDGNNRTVRYWWDPDLRRLMRAEAGTERIMLASVREIQFRFFNALGIESNRQQDIKMIQLNAELQRRVRATTNTNYVISARFTMRNKIIGT